MNLMFWAGTVSFENMSIYWLLLMMFTVEIFTASPCCSFQVVQMVFGGEMN